MTPEKLSALLAILNPAVIQHIMDKKNLTNIEAVKLFYNSDLYAALEDEATKLWHLSALTLYELLDEELTARFINYPEEA